MSSQKTTSTRELLFRQIFRLSHRREPEQWELVLGLALVDGDLVINRLPQAAELRSVHYVAHGTRYSLGLAERELTPLERAWS